MQVNPYLMFDGRCEEAFKLYEQALGGKVEAIMRYGGSPGEAMAPPDWGDKVMHAAMTIGSTVLMGSDAPPDQHQPAQGTWVSLHCDSVEETERVWSALAEGGSVQMPLEETFWAERFGSVVDRFGTPWMIGCDKAE